MYDTTYHTFLIPALHQTNVNYTLFENWEDRKVGIYYLNDIDYPFKTASTNDTVYLTINY